MAKLLVAGLINIETTLQVDAFPIPYFPVRYPFFGVNSSVSGVGFNVAKALTVLGDQVEFLSLVGEDFAGKIVLETLREVGIPVRLVIPGLARTPQSVVLYNQDGQRQINVDLKDIQDQVYPVELFEQVLWDCSLAVLCNINFSRPFLKLASQAGKPVATDVHAISELDDAYNRAYMAAADILFMSDENLPCSPEKWARRLINLYPAEIIVIGLGAQGALLSVRSEHFLERLPVVSTRPVVNSLGAGDALFSAFVHFYQASDDAPNALQKAMIFASYKIGETGAADGFLDEISLEGLCASLK